MNMISTVFRCLEENYLGKETPKLNVMFFDTEVDSIQIPGYPTTDDPKSTRKLLHELDGLTGHIGCTKTISMKDAQELTKRFDNTMLLQKEKDMLDAFYN